MNCAYDYIPIPPCANCGKEERGHMSASAWGHGYSCCSDACGKRLASKLENGTGGPVPGASGTRSLFSLSGQEPEDNDRIARLRLRIKQLERRKA